ncbi:hypothetical protein ACFVFQ_31850 [Streptomyces sp. NPDC057743]|uniref:hypothetical protein n=1 Tax=Streptomyces sp. NPDC057743 TaxID=3346236 RepID=UPI00368E7762
MTHEDTPATGRGTRPVSFRYAMSGTTRDGAFGLVSGVVDLDLNYPRSTRESAFQYVLGLLAEHMGTWALSISHFSFERNAL